MNQQYQIVIILVDGLSFERADEIGKAILETYSREIDAQTVEPVDTGEEAGDAETS